MTEDTIDDTAAPLIEHLAELRRRLIWSVLAFIVAMFAVYPFAMQVFNFLSHPICRALAETGQNCLLQLISPQEGFFVAINISLFGGLFLAFPVIGFQLWRFVAPGLYRSEKNAMLPFLLASPVMFFLGAVFAYYVVLPMAFGFFLTFQQMGQEAANVVANAPGSDVATQGTAAAGEAPIPGIVFQGSAQEYLGLTMKFVLAFGLCFQLPVLLVLLGKAGIISSHGLTAMRKYAIVAILVLAAVATPPDVMSQVILFAAVYPLYEVSVILIRMIEKKREARLRAEGLWEDEEEAE
ncbi:Sec-independent protein translocase protein TatC [Gemmobacter aquaticus]|jgi:sec-independent protein translocase protein TatC|uniref:Sec-independent protein translocase protein TatC n=1 Tax=Gemmobacter aquaticus TaxID=490185 RepID=A0A917YHI2_9RHOB|nr:twin-arginine translocase subunit TatC [Gemmobacter aquaticus]GGO27114.1 Sec-independent protein translocase protein TatC [Gemmobacter aquaticus]